MDNKQDEGANYVVCQPVVRLWRKIKQELGWRVKVVCRIIQGGRRRPPYKGDP